LPVWFTGFTFVRVSTEEEPAARILVVEDDPEARATFDLLLGARWAVTLLEWGEEARLRALETPFDLVIASAQMSGFGGLELVRLLRGHRPTQDVPLILTSLTAGQRETIAGLEAGADDFLVKPFSGRELLVRVQTRLELTAMRRRNAQQELALASLTRSLHARDEFLSAASHELRTPITTLSLQTDGLLNTAEVPGNGHHTALNDRLRRRLSAIRRQVVRLNQLVDQLLDVSQFIEGRLDLHPEEVDLQALIIDAIELMRDSATSAGSPVLFRLHNEVVGRWDRVRLGQVVTNLLSNAIKFGCGRPIEVELDADNTRACLAVKDSGEGIPRQEQARIFERFERATSVQRHPGLGLGLWICKQIVDACHGTISVQSEPGQGSVFSVQLPRALS
jgi:signal transduction histidine kinase